MPDEVIVVPEPRQPTNDFLAVIQYVTERGITNEQLSGVLDLHERFRKSQAEAAYAKDMAIAQARMRPVVRDAENKGTRSRYARLEAIDNAIRPIYTDCGFSISFDEEKADKPNHMRLRADVMHRDGHMKSYRLELALDGVGAKGNALAMNAVQAGGSTSSYIRRYAKKFIFDLVESDEDNDGQGDNWTIGPGQIQKLNDGLEASGVRLAAFLQWLALESLDQMPVREFANAVGYLQRKARQNGGGK